jgi:hypothetical protein
VCSLPRSPRPRAACPITYSKFPKEAFATGTKTTSLFNAVITEGVKQKLINATCQGIAQAHLPMCMADLSLQDGCCDKTCADALLLVRAREPRARLLPAAGWLASARPRAAPWHKRPPGRRLRTRPEPAIGRRLCRPQSDNSECSKQFLRAFCNVANGAYFQVPL